MTRPVRSRDVTRAVNFDTSSGGHSPSITTTPSRNRGLNGRSSSIARTKSFKTACTGFNLSPVKDADGEVHSLPSNILLDVYVFGTGMGGELGFGLFRSEEKELRLNGILDSRTVGAISLAVGGMHALVLTRDNRLLSWGINDNGALG